MGEQSARGTGRIYDLGYRPYEGERLGRGYATLSHFIYSLRAIFGIGRSTVSKVFPIVFAVIAFVPALVQLAIAAISPADFELIEHEDYFVIVSIVLVLFCAFAAPEVVGRDQRFRTITLYFSRALARVDYVSASLAALTVALLLVLLTPQIILLLGSAVASDDSLGYLRDNLDKIPPIIASSIVVALFMASLSMALACWTPRRALATVGVLAYFIILSAVAEILVESTTGDVQKYVLLIGPIKVLEGAVIWIFNVVPDPDSDVGIVGLGGVYYLLAAGCYIAVSLGVLYRRFLRLAV